MSCFVVLPLVQPGLGGPLGRQLLSGQATGPDQGDSLGKSLVSEPVFISVKQKEASQDEMGQCMKRTGALSIFYNTQMLSLPLSNRG